MKVTRTVGFVLMILACRLIAAESLVLPHNVLLFIGDGMGPEQVRAARLFTGTPLSFEGLPQHASCTTFSADNAVTDSAAAATAIATGHKVNRGVISLALPGEGNDLKTLLEYYAVVGKKTGLITTTILVHATPAGFGAHTTSRKNFDEIATDYLGQTRPDLMLGGGGSGLSVSNCTSAGYTVATNRAGLVALGSVLGDGQRIAGLFGEDQMPFEKDGVGDLPHLSEMTAVALDLLEEDPDGVFMMVEGGRIDHACHGNDLARSIGETIEFSKAVQLGMDWAAAHSNTLVLVTADHETGGLTIVNPGAAHKLSKVTWSTGGHTATPVPVYAIGPNSPLVTGQIDNTDVFRILGGELLERQSLETQP